MGQGPLKRRYVFRRAWARALAGGFDFLGERLWRRRKSAPVTSPRRILVIRLDQLGDSVLAAPLLGCLRDRYPEAEIVFLCSPGSARLYKAAGDMVRIEPFAAPWLQPASHNHPKLKSWRELKQKIFSIKPDMILELRGDVRHILAARLAAPEAYIAGYGVTGGGFLLDRVEFDKADEHAATRNLRLVDGKRAETGLERVLGGEPVASDPRDERFDEPGFLRVALHPGAAAPSKLWPRERWVECLGRWIAEDGRVVFGWIGDGAVQKFAADVEQLLGVVARNRFIHAEDRVPLESIGAYLAGFDLLVTTDSFPAHLAAHWGVPAVVVFSGANRLSEWSPLTQYARLLNRTPPCSPCFLRVCPLADHPCMNGVTAMEVLAAAKELAVLARGRGRGPEARSL